MFSFFVMPSPYPLSSVINLWHDSFYILNTHITRADLFDQRINLKYGDEKKIANNYTKMKNISNYGGIVEIYAPHELVAISACWKDWLSI